jgi:DnaK suppressor protein
MSDQADLDLADVRRRLLEEREALVTSSEQDRESRRPVTLDQQSVGRLSRMDALQMQAMALETERRRQTRRRRLDAALERLADGEFGFCVKCGEPIARPRLEFDLTSPTCIACARDQS